MDLRTAELIIPVYDPVLPVEATVVRIEGETVFFEWSEGDGSVEHSLAAESLRVGDRIIVRNEVANA